MNKNWSFTQLRGFVVILFALAVSYCYAEPKVVWVISTRIEKLPLRLGNVKSAALFGRIEPIKSYSRAMSLAVGERVQGNAKPIKAKYNADDSSVELIGVENNTAHTFAAIAQSHGKKVVLVSDAIQFELEDLSAVFPALAGYAPIEYHPHVYTAEKLNSIKADAVIVASDYPYLYLNGGIKGCVIVTVFPEDNRHFGQLAVECDNLSDGIATSSSTRHIGIISESDIAPMVLQCLGIRNERPGIDIETASPETLEQFWMWENFHRTSAIWMLVVIGSLIGLWLIIRLVQFYQGKPKSATSSIESGFVISLPAGMLIAGYLRTPEIWSYTLIMLMPLFACIIWFAEPCRRKQISLLWTVCLASLVIVLADALTSRTGATRSIFSVNYYTGVRIYGLDNNDAGYLLGLAISAMHGFHATFANRLRKGTILFISIVFSLGISFMLGYPEIGANAGGIAASTAGLGGAVWILSGKRHSLRVAVLLIVAGAAAAFGMSWFDYALNGSKATHMGLAFIKLIGGYESAQSALWGKLMTLKRIVLSPYMWATGIGIAALMLGFHRSLDNLKERYSGVEKIKPLTDSLLWTAFCCIIFNDSGLVSASLLFGFVFVFLLDSGWSNEQKRINAATPL